MGLKVIHIDRRKIDFEARTREFRETVLKPKWEKHSRAQAEKLMANLIRDSKASTPEFTTSKERIVRGEKVKIVTDVDGDSLNINCITKIRVK